jgi:hypothetical protein
MSDAPAPSWEPGGSIVVRDIAFGAVVHARPMVAVSASNGVFASYLPIGTEYFGILFEDRESAVDDLARGDLRWGKRTWVQHNALVLVRQGDPYSVYGFWNEEGAFVAWYANLQDPLRWTHFGYDTRDNALDVIIGGDLASWMWKDERELEALVGMGLYTEEEAGEIRRAGEQVIELVETGHTWWGEWRDWTPDPSWSIPTLPEGWDQGPTSVVSA